MPDAAFCRAQAAAYLKLAQGCDDPLLAEQLRLLSRRFAREAERKEQQMPAMPPPLRRE